jgi:Ankyrin repeats (3 copies)
MGGHVSPLQFACLTALDQTSLRLLSENEDVEEREDGFPGPIHLLIAGQWKIDLKQEGLSDLSYRSPICEARQLKVVKHLVTFKVDLSSTTEVRFIGGTLYGERNKYEFSPLCLAISKLKPSISQYLIDSGASLTADTGGLGPAFENFKVIQRRVKPEMYGTEMVGVLQRVSRKVELTEQAVKSYQTKQREEQGLETSSARGELGVAISAGDVSHVRSMLLDENIEINLNHALWACELGRWNIVALLQDYGVYIADGDVLSVFEMDSREARKHLGPLQYLEVIVSAEKLVDIFLHRYMTLAWDFPSPSEMDNLLKRLTGKEAIRAKNLIVKGLSPSAPEGVRFMLSRGQLDDQQKRNLVAKSCSRNSGPEGKTSDTLRMLLKSGVHPDIYTTDGKFVPHSAVEDELRTHVGLLLKFAANPNIRDNLGRTPLFMVNSNGDTMDGYEEIIELLRKEGARFDHQAFDGSTVLHSAVKNGDSLVLGILLDISGFPNVKDIYGASALHYASVSGDAVMVSLLLRRRRFPASELDDQSDIHGSALYAAAVSICEKNEESIKIPELLIKAGANVNITGHSQPLGTPLMVAVLSGNWRLAAFLLVCGADKWLGNERFSSPGEAAEKLHNREILDLLARYPRRQFPTPMKMITYPEYEEDTYSWGLYSRDPSSEDGDSEISESNSWSTVTSSSYVITDFWRRRTPKFRTVRFKNAIFRYRWPPNRRAYSERIVIEERAKRKVRNHYLEMSDEVVVIEEHSPRPRRRSRKGSEVAVIEESSPSPLRSRR